VERDPDLEVDIASLPTNSLNTCAYDTDAHIVLGYGDGPECVTLSATASGGHGPYTYSWDAPAAVPAANFTGTNTATPTFCADFQTDPCVTYTFRVTATDIHGCEETEVIAVNVVNAGIFADGSQCVKPNNPKVVVCHDGPGNTQSQKSLCLHPNAVNVHLNGNGNGHAGDCLGACDALCISLEPASMKTQNLNASKYEGNDESGPFMVQVSPNPFSEKTEIKIVTREDTRAQLAIFDISGRQVANLYEGGLKKDVSYYFNFDAGNLGAGVYFAKLIGEQGHSGIAKMVLVE
jgi:hypothetical protein